MAVALIVLAVLVVVGGVIASRISTRREARSVDHYSRAMQVLAEQEHQPAGGVRPAAAEPGRVPLQSRPDRVRVQSHPDRPPVQERPDRVRVQSRVQIREHVAVRPVPADPEHVYSQPEQDLHRVPVQATPDRVPVRTPRDHVPVQATPDRVPDRTPRDRFPVESSPGRVPVRSRTALRRGQGAERIPARQLLRGSVDAPPAAPAAPVPAEQGPDALSGLRAMEDRLPATFGSGGRPTGLTPGGAAVEEVVRMVGVFEDRSDHDPGVEANARLTAGTGLLLVVLFFLEGLTLPLIHRVVSWHVVIGLALIPPVMLKMGSTLWRFSRYYLGDRRYRQAGPPHPFLRLLGPVVLGSTAVLIISGVATWLAGPQNQLLFRVHQLTFVLWFGVVALHLLSHLLRAVRLAAADSRDAKQPRSRAQVPGARGRRLVVVLSLVVGFAVGSLGLMVSSPWTSRATGASHQVTPPPTAPTPHPGG